MTKGSAGLSGGTPVAFVPTADLDRSHAFYSGVLGLNHLETTPVANVYRLGAITLRVTLVPSLNPQPHTVLGWDVAEVGEAVSALRERDVEFLFYDGMDQGADGIWTAPSGARIAWFHDPDGNVLSVSEGATARQPPS